MKQTWAPEREILNPRRLKRFINWLSVSLQLISALNRSSCLDNLAILQLLMLRRHYPRFYPMLLSSSLDELSTWWERNNRPLPNGYSRERLTAFLAPLTAVDIGKLDQFMVDNSLVDPDKAVEDVDEAAGAAVSKYTGTGADEPS
jgi:hypothetical protein